MTKKKWHTTYFDILKIPVHLDDRLNELEKDGHTIFSINTVNNPYTERCQIIIVSYIPESSGGGYSSNWLDQV